MELCGVAASDAREEYERKWKLKLEWYQENGVKLAEEGGGPNGTLLTSTEIEGIDHSQLLALIKKIKSGA